MDASRRLSSTEKAVALVSVAVVVFVLAIGLPVLDPSIPPSKNLAILPGSNGGLIRSCTASSAASWISCIAKVNAGQAQRVYVNGVIEC
jgi:hypothetical protein